MRFLATADLHIRKKEDAALLARIFDRAREAGCGAVLIGGDLLDSPFPPPETASALMRLLEAAPCPVFIAAGNHDPLAVTAFYRSLPEGVYCFPEELTAAPLSAPGLHLFGCSAPREQSDRRILAGFAAPEGALNILLAHGQVDGGDFQPISARELAESRFQLAVIGHIHKGGQRRIGGCHLLVPGIPEGRGWDETGEKWVYLIDAEPEGGVAVEPVSVAERTYREYPVDLTGCADSGAILAALEAVSVPPHTEARLILTGAPGESPEAAARVYTERTGRDVKDRSDPSLSVELLRGQNTLQGAFVRRALAELETAPPEERPLLEEALRLGLAALKEARL